MHRRMRRTHPPNVRRVADRTDDFAPPGDRMASLTLDQLRKVYPNGQVAVHGASVDVADGELLVLVGPSGCGKSTLLRMIAGLEDISAGTLKIGARIVNDLPPK